MNIVSKATATRELQELVGKGVLIKVGETGKGTYYRLRERAQRKINYVEG